MNSHPGRLTGGGIRTLPADRVGPMLARLRDRHHKTFKARSVRYRVSGFRDPDSGAWISRDPANGNYYRVAGRARADSKRRASGQAARRRTKVKPTADILSRSDMLALEVEVDRGKGPRIYYLNIDGVR